MIQKIFEVFELIVSIFLIVVGVYMWIFWKNCGFSSFWPGVFITGVGLWLLANYIIDNHLNVDNHSKNIFIWKKKKEDK